jgi:uncharacterized protein (DUF3084 family)
MHRAVPHGTAAEHTTARGQVLAEASPRMSSADRKKEILQVRLYPCNSSCCRIRTTLQRVPRRLATCLRPFAAAVMCVEY